MWNKISTAPKNKEIILGVDSYDCGWVFDTGIHNGNGWKIPHIKGDSFCHMHYTHWLEPKLLYWRNIIYAPKDKVVVLGRKHVFRDMEVCSAWWSENDGKWVSTGTSNKTFIESEFTLFAIPENLPVHLISVE